MKALCVRQPWAWAIVNGHKLIENRSWRSNYRGPLLIHATKPQSRSDERDDLEFVANRLANESVPASFFRDLVGAVIGAVDMIDCVDEINAQFARTPAACGLRQIDRPWFFGPYGFQFDRARILPPLPQRGRLGIFETGAKPVVDEHQHVVWAKDL